MLRLEPPLLLSAFVGYRGPALALVGFPGHSGSSLVVVGVCKTLLVCIKYIKKKIYLGLETCHVSSPYKPAATVVGRRGLVVAFVRLRWPVSAVMDLRRLLWAFVE